VTGGNCLNPDSRNASTPKGQMDDVIKADMEDVDESLGLKEVQRRSKTDGISSNPTQK